jgi:hypothetical protein
VRAVTTLYLSDELLERLEPREGNERTSVVSLSASDMPEEVSTTRTPAGDVELRFTYPDREPAAPEEALDEQTEPALRVTRGRHCGKILTLRVVPASADNAWTVRMLAPRIEEAAKRQRRKNQQLNYRLLARILDTLGDKLTPAG